jgi:ribosomal protein L3 glutamine methyltransferase
MKLRDLVQAVAQALTAAQLSFGHGTNCAEDEAAWLVLWALGLPLDTPLDAGQAHADLLLSDAQCAQVDALLTQRITERKPLAYLTGEAWLQGYRFYVDERVIIPRSLIAELLVGGGIDYWLHTTTSKVLDLCTGNASLAIIAASVFPDVLVDAADISQDALEVARINLEQHGLQERVNLLHSDGFSHVPSSYDLLLCNPPYVNAQSMAALPPEFQHEPRMALDGNTQGGSDGMDFVRMLLREAPKHMHPGAVLVLEIGHERPFFEAAFPTLNVVWLETSAGEDQVLLLTREALLS